MRASAGEEGLTVLGTQVRVGEHVVRFYEDDHDLLSLVSPHLGAALLDDQTAVIIATPAHRELIIQHVAEMGIDITRASESGQLVILDADDTLNRFLRLGTPDFDAFTRSVGQVVLRACDRGRPVHAFGEMVALLWERGQVPAALELERLWNTLAEKHPFSLVCAYPQRLFTQPGLADAFDDICSAHTSVIAGAPVLPDVDASRRIARSTTAPWIARRFVADHLLADGQFDLVDGARLAVSELVSNVVDHTESDVTVGLRRTPTGVRVLVGDTSQERPVVLPDSSNLTSRRGLLLVQVVADDWGVDQVDSGKIVWADLRPSYRPAGPRRHSTSAAHQVRPDPSARRSSIAASQAEIAHNGCAAHHARRSRAWGRRRELWADSVTIAAGPCTMASQSEGYSSGCWPSRKAGCSPCS